MTVERDPASRVGETVATGGGAYRLAAVLGVGSTAVVYRAARTGDAGVGAHAAAQVAIKVLHGEIAHDAAMRARFVREAYVANLVEHVGVVRVLADGTTSDGAPCLVMELLEGETIEARWERKGRKLPVSEVLWYADKVLSVLARAHDCGVVHRDIKPENLFVTEARIVKVLDFGIARLRDASLHDDEPSVTRAGSLIGTLAFMPPEQARGEVDAVGVQTDLWAVGATMFTLVTGQYVHGGAGFYALLTAAALTPPPSLAAIAPEIPNAVVELVDYALSFDPAKRWANARIMQRAVREVYGILRARAQARASAPHVPHLSSPPPDSAPVSAPELEMPTKLVSVEPPPMSRVLTSPVAGSGASASAGARAASTRAPAPAPVPGTSSLRGAPASPSASNVEKTQGHRVATAALFGVIAVVLAVAIGAFVTRR